MQCLILLTLLSALALGFPSNISAHDDYAVLIYCDNKNFHDHCDYGKFDRCTPLIECPRRVRVYAL